MRNDVPSLYSVFCRFAQPCVGNRALRGARYLVEVPRSLKRWVMLWVRCVVLCGELILVRNVGNPPLPIDTPGGITEAVDRSCPLREKASGLCE